MPTEVWYEASKEFYIMEFVDDPVFDLPKWAMEQQQTWGAIWHHLLVTSVDDKFLYHRIAIEMQHRPKEFIRDDLEAHLHQFARSLKYMRQKSGQYDPPGYTSQQCLRAGEILETEHNTLLQRLMSANPALQTGQ